MARQKKIFSQKFFSDLVKKNPHKDSFLLRLAKSRQHEKPFINSLNRMIAKLPKEIKSDAEFLSRITSVRDEDFRGALGELITYYILKTCRTDPIWKPQIGPRTPDFFCEMKYRSFAVETFSIGLTKDEEEQRQTYNAIHQELRKVESKFKIFIQGSPRPDSSGNFHGLGKALKKFLKSKRKYGERAIFSVVTPAGASMRFHVQRTEKFGKVFWGSISDKHHWDKYSDLIENGLMAKAKKYKFPFVASCVVGPNSRASLEDLLGAIIGHPAMSVTIHHQEPEKLTTVATNTYQGFWGHKNKDFERHHLVQGILFVQPVLHGAGLSLHSYFIENPYFRSDLQKVFKNLPNPLKPKRKIPSTEVKAFIFEI